MLTGLLHAHSGLRYLVLAAGTVALLYALYGLATRREHDRVMRITATAFAGLLHLQVLLGLGLLVAGLYRPEVLVHLGFMLAAAVVAQLAPSLMRRRSPEERGYTAHALSALVSLALIWFGIRALGVELLGSGIG